MQKPELKKVILIVDDDVDYRSALQNALRADFEIRTAGSIAEARDRLDIDIALALIDVRLREGEDDRDGLILLESIRQTYPQIPVVMMTSFADLDIAVEALNLGARHFIQKTQLEVVGFRNLLQMLLHAAQLELSNKVHNEQMRFHKPSDLLGTDPKIEGVREMIEIAASNGNYTVMVRGETGVGKEVVARAVHSRGHRSDKPFVELSIAGLPPELISTELFGHVKGAYTDAKEARVGYIEKAQGGVLFLDEIGELRQDAQRTLLRFLETRKFARVGSTTEIEVDIQIVCATNRDLEAAIASGEFREDLYYRLQSFEIWLPPLRERGKDILLLADHFLNKIRPKVVRCPAGFTPAAIDKLQAGRFPGNVRELKNVVERAAGDAAYRLHTLIDAEDIRLGALQQAPVQVNPFAIGEAGIDLFEELAKTELGFVEEALRISNGRKTDAWKILQLNDRFALYNRVMRIKAAYPHILERFPVIAENYGN